MALATWLFVTVALIGNLGIINQKRWGFGCWIVSNFGLIAVNFYIQMWPQCFLFFVYLLLSVWGFVRWGATPDQK
jgi:hypothetical protein